MYAGSGGSCPATIDVASLPACVRVVRESLRLVPPAALLARHTTAPLTLDGKDVPLGTDVWVPAVYLHKDEASWGSSAAEFDPARFALGAAPPPRLV